ncbi:MAG: 50S ribosomal protein L31e [Candidatus Aenigmarchaeota archaeon]|nr:50S ribosomal protein L31e [Candidatus Aenigmarchaeota archaeon]
MANERIYTINLRKDYIKVARWRRANRAMRFIKEYIKRHMKVEEVKIGKELNEYIWYRSREKPPGRVRVIVTKEDKVAKVDLFRPKEEKVEEIVEEKVKEEKDEGKAHTSD